MSLLQRISKTLGIFSLAIAGPIIASGQLGYVPQAAEYAPAGNLPGDQAHPQLALKPSGGLMVWEDNVSDGNGLGISAVRLDSSFSSPFGGFRVNQQGTNDQERPHISLLNNGGAAIVWQGGKQGFQHIYARFLSSSNTFVTGDVMVNATTNYYQINPVITTLPNGNVIVSWSSFGQDGSMQGIYAQQLTAAGAKVGAEIPVNQFTSYNQRTPAIASLSSGGFIIVWVSEQQRHVASTNGTIASVDIYGRLYNSAAVPLGNEFLINTGASICANPAVAAASDGSFCVTWDEKDVAVINNSWDIWARTFSSAGLGGTVRRVNTQVYGDQYAPNISVSGTDYFVVWTSLGQDGSREGVYGQFLRGDGSLAGGEVRVNTSTLGSQMQPALASDGTGRFLAVWMSFIGGLNSYDLFAQRFATFQQPLVPPDRPFVTPINSSRLSLAWPVLAGFNVANYDLYIDGSANPTIATNNFWTMTGLSPSSSHSFRLDYVLTDGRRSPLSATSVGTTWGADDNSDGLPDDWQAMYWGANSANWPAPSTLLGLGGPTVLQAFLSGSNPLDPSTWFMAKTIMTSQGEFLIWNTQPGSIYQVMNAAKLDASWTNLGAPRFAAGTNDSIFLGHSQSGFYKVSRLRY
jgi:hypothetical protein